MDRNLQDIPVAELAELFDWMVPPSRKHELEMYRNNLRRQAVREADKEVKEARGSKPGERMEDPRGYWTRSHGDVDGSVGGAYRENPPTRTNPLSEQAPGVAATASTAMAGRTTTSHESVGRITRRSAYRITD